MKTVNSFFRYVMGVLTSPFFLFFCCGFLLALELYFYQENKYETQLFQSLADDVLEKSDTCATGPKRVDAVFVNATQLTHDLVQNRMNRFAGLEQQSGFKVFLQPVAYDLMTGNGACGSNSYVLSRLLMQLGYNVRIAQMGIKNSEKKHIITEAWNGKNWVALDALYNLSFRNDSGLLAPFSDVSTNWNHYKFQVPANYPKEYTYYSVRYTNWSKIPIVLPAIKKVLEFTIGKKVTDKLCLRKFYIRKYYVLMQINFVLILLVMFVTFLKWRKIAIVDHSDD